MKNHSKKKIITDKIDIINNNKKNKEVPLTTEIMNFVSYLDTFIS